MPHVTVHFIPSLVDQQMIDRLKKHLQLITADALSDPTTIFPDCAGQENITVSRGEIFVRQEAAHKTDVNPAPIEIVVDAGRSRGRNPDATAERIECKLSALLPSRLRGEDQACVWVRFHEQNGFRFTRER